MPGPKAEMTNIEDKLRAASQEYVSKCHEWCAGIASASSLQQATHEVAAGIGSIPLPEPTNIARAARILAAKITSALLAMQDIGRSFLSFKPPHGPGGKPTLLLEIHAEQSGKLTIPEIKLPFVGCAFPISLLESPGRWWLRCAPEAQSVCAVCVLVAFCKQLKHSIHFVFWAVF